MGLEVVIVASFRRVIEMSGSQNDLGAGSVGFAAMNICAATNMRAATALPLAFTTTSRTLEANTTADICPVGRISVTVFRPNWHEAPQAEKSCCLKRHQLEPEALWRAMSCGGVLGGLAITGHSQAPTFELAQVWRHCHQCLYPMLRDMGLPAHNSRAAYIKRFRDTVLRSKKAHCFTFCHR